MIKITSMLEKLNLIEKFEKKSVEGSTSETVDSIEPDINKEILEIKDEKSFNKSFESTKFEEVTSMEQKLKYDKSLQHDKNLKYDKNLEINDIYTQCDLKISNINTVFMLDSFINALPQNLPQDVVKHSVMNIISASEINLNTLISDGEQRLMILNRFIDEYNNSMNTAIDEYKTEIAKLTNSINKIKEQIKIKDHLLEEQNLVIKYETQKINSIIDFFQ